MSKGISRGTNALSVINKFNRTAAVLYVEGPTDRIFWKTLLDFYNIKNISIKVAGSCTIIDDYIKKILNEDLKIYVARDKDYKFNLGKIPKHNRILLSFGHSIENTLVHHNSLAEIGVCSGGNHEQCQHPAIEWHNYVEDKLEQLIIREFANEATGAGISIFGDHGDFIFGKSWSSRRFPDDKIRLKLSEADKILPPKSISAAEKVVNNEITHLSCFVRGHFLFSIALKFVKEMMSNILEKDNYSLSNDALFTMLSINFMSAMTAGLHPHKEHYDHEVGKLAMLTA
ncbi:TPA: DUF4435 domain-containing protein [Serratia marcescens]|uniref:DUF4435 domain-containing protein n=1 Tax=Serratia marcescens TaxID=615 RepID=UPI000B5FDD39|nr:DUF4435 domain-containing protein [Serratia marcescens]ASL84783.1 hypothetical protein BVG95_18515 [Serratia marcescens]